MNRKNLFFLTAGLFGGILICCVLFSFLGKGGRMPLEADAAQETSEEKETFTVSASFPEWSGKEVYLGGDEVLYQERIYKAKWWTQNEIPGKSDVWEDTLETPALLKEADMPEEKTEDAAGRKEVLNNDFKAVAYYPSWSGEQFQKLQLDVLTHVVYAFAIPNSDGSLKPLENPQLAKKLIDLCHSHGVKTLLAVGGWSDNGTPLEPNFNAAVKDQETLAKFGDSILALCDSYGFDGIDVDWEHPRVDGNSSARYEALMMYLGERLHEKGKLLTAAVISGATPDGAVYYDAAAHTDRVLNTVDWIHVMAYDGGDGNRHSSYEFAAACGAYWKDTRHMPASKVVLGVPFYGRPSWASYENLLAADSEAWNKDVSNYNGMEVWYNGMGTIEKKTAYAKQNLGGIMIWEITQDASDKEKSLLSAVKRALNR